MIPTMQTSRPIVIRARRDTVALVAGAVAATFALSYAIHARPERAGLAPNSAKVEMRQDWAGGLAEIAPAIASPVPLTSASLVVPKSDLALPATPMRPLVKLRGCGDSNCVAKATAIPVRRVVSNAEAYRVDHRSYARGDGSLMSSLNPLNHLPDISIVRRPLVYAGNTFSNWFRRDERNVRCCGLASR